MLLNDDELAGCVVAGGHLPVEVVQVEDRLDVAVGEEDDFLAVEGAEEWRGQDAVEGAGLADGEDELGEHGGGGVVAGFGLGPEQGAPLARALGRLGVEGEVDVALDHGGVEGLEPVGGDLVLEFLLAYALVAHGAKVVIGAVRAVCPDGALSFLLWPLGLKPRAVQLP